MRPRCAPGRDRRASKKYLQVACTSLLTYYFLGGRDLPSFRDFIYSDLHGTVVVHDRYVNYDPFDGVVHQLCTAHLLRDLEDAAQSYPDAHWPGQIARDTARPHPPGEHRPRPRPGRRPRRTRSASTCGCSATASTSACPRSAASPAAQDQAAARPAPAGMPRAPRGRRAAVPHRHRHPAHLRSGFTLHLLGAFWSYRGFAVVRLCR